MGRPICLITPPSQFLLDERVFMTLGILKVAAALEKAGHRVEHLDLSGVENYEDAVKDHASRSEAIQFGLTATTPQLPTTTKVVRVLKKTRPDAKLILGGPHITLVAAARKGELKRGGPGRAAKAFDKLASMFDVLVAGDGEFAVLKAVADDSPAFIDADDPSSDLFLTNQTLEEHPVPARHLVDVDSYKYTIDEVPALSMIAQLGCPFECGFCGGRQSPMLRRVRMRSSESVVSEMENLHQQYGKRGFMLYDDELNVNPKLIELLKQTCDLQEKVGADFRLRGFVKAQLFTDEQAEWMVKAGFRWLLTGFESGSPRVLENINKRATRDENTRCVEIARRHGLKVKALMSIGHPGESERTVRETHDWLLEVKPDDFDITIITPYPGTPYYDRAVPVNGKRGVHAYTFEKTGDKLYSEELDYTEVADYYKGDPDGGYQAFVHTDALSAEKLVKMRDATERDVREKLDIPFNPSRVAMRYEHSMGQSGALPSNILRSS